MSNSQNGIMFDVHVSSIHGIVIETLIVVPSSILINEIVEIYFTKDYSSYSVSNPLRFVYFSTRLISCDETKTK